MIARYTRPEMGVLFTDKSKFDAWLKVELAVCEAWAERGVIPMAAYKRIKRKARFRLKRIEEIEAQVHHDVIAFNTAVADYIGEDSAYFHKGLTSSDVVDTAQNLILKEAGRLLEVGLGKLRQAMGKQAVKYKNTPMIGRTHGVHAEPTTLGLKLLIFHDELTRHEERLAIAIDGLGVGKLSGAVGNFANIPPDIETEVLRKLGLAPAPVSNQVVQRDRHAQFICILAGIGATMEKIAIHFRTGQRTELGELQEPFAKGQKGSSAMPHKKNPILLERVTGLARVLRGYAVTALENVALWDERDISHSGAERVILPDACILLDYMFAKLTGVVEGLVVREERLRKNIYFTHGLVFSQRVLLALAEAGVSRENAYTIVQRNAMRCWEDGTPLLDALKHDSDVRAVLKADQISDLFSLTPYLKHVDAIFARCGLGEAPRPEPVPAKAKSRGRDRGKAKPKPSEAPPPLPEPGTHSPVQNIIDRPSDWYDSAMVAVTDALSKVPVDSDETLGEATHQKRPPRRDAVVKPDRDKADAEPEKKKRPPRRRAKKPAAAKPDAMRKSEEGAMEKPAGEEPKPATEDKAKEEKKPARRRRSRSRRPAKPADTRPSQDSDDDTYID